LGGLKVKRRDRTNYDGVALAAQKLQVHFAPKAAAQLRSGDRRAVASYKADDACRGAPRGLKLRHETAR
jgi:hypothetical protein